jgi:uncharacterized repeat protein (TIGR01451 family)
MNKITIKSLFLIIVLFSFESQLFSQCNPDVTGPIATCNGLLNVSLGTDGTAVVGVDMINESSWDFCDGTNVDLAISVLTIGNPPPTTIPTSTEITFNCCQTGTHFLNLWVTDQSGNTSSCWSEISLEDVGNNCPSAGIDCTEKYIRGNVFLDANQDCQYGSETPTGEGKKVVATTYPDKNFQYEGTVEADGSYEIILPFDDGKDYEIAIIDVPTQVLTCGNNFIKSIPNGSDELIQHFPIKFVENCPFMFTDVSAPFLRRCFTNTVKIATCNYSNQLVTDAYVIVQYDPFLEVQSSSINGIPLGNNIFQYDLGDFSSGECITIDVEVLVDCEAELGQTHCILANVFPQKECITTDPNWSGAIIQTSAECEGDSIKFVIENVGDQAMIGALDFTIVEDVVMYMEGEYNLGAGELFVEKVPANGATWRLETIQEPGYPEWLYPASWMEGCGGLNNTGIVLQFPTATNASSATRFCMENQGSFDPNDKQSFPRGYGDNHYIKQNRDIDYLIRFQNTGTDTAFNIVIKDTLSEHLLWGSIRAGVSSHPYELKTQGDGILEFVFEDIMLPDSSSNEPASHGFVQFKISQVPDLPDGVVIENSAAIYFDFNEPIITNTTWLTVGDEFISSSQNIFVQNVEVNVMPNPLESSALFKVKGMDLTEGQLKITDVTGRVISQQNFTGNEVRFYRNGLSSGLYFYQILDGKELIATGKLLIN